MKFGPYFINYPDSLRMDGVSLDLVHDTYHIVGSNGSGKSTLLSAIVDECNKQSYEYSFINQNYRANWLWWKSIRQNLEYPLNLGGGKLSIESNSEYVYHKKWLEPLLSKKTQVDFSQMNEQESVGVSGGQLQKLVFLRELVLKPQLLLLDEAFSALDVEAVIEICNWLKEAQKRLNFKILSISHDPQILKLLGGHVIEVVKDKNFEVTVRSTDLQYYKD
jgi:ABC-type Mn2+/Zn2+ transport system ATPase subunit